MHTMEDLARAFYAPGRVGREFRSRDLLLSPAELAARFFVLVAIPALGFGWVLLYTLTGGTSFRLTLQYGTAVDLGFVALQPAVLVPVLAGIIAFAFWFIPTALFFGINALVPANRINAGSGFFSNFIAATSSSFGIFYAFLALSFWLMTSQATFFWGMRTIEDKIFSIALLGSLVLQLGSLFVTSKNYFDRGLGGSVIALVMIGGLLSGLVSLLIT